MKIIFFGSDDFALRHLEALVASSQTVVAVVTQPDRCRDRGMRMQDSPIKDFALSKDIDVLQPTDLHDVEFVNACKGYDADIFVVIAYGRFLPQLVLDIPHNCAINVHGSLLPKYRGAAPINWAIINGEKETGISIIKLNVRMDAGDVISYLPMPIDACETAVTLRAKMMSEGPTLLLGTLQMLESEPDVQICEAQNEAAASFAPKLHKKMGLIDWNKPAIEIDRMIRGLVPWPVAYTNFADKRLKILEAVIVDCDCEKAIAGSVVAIDKSGFVIATAEQCLLIKKVHYEASKPMDAFSFTLGHPVKMGYSFFE